MNIRTKGVTPMRHKLIRRLAKLSFGLSFIAFGFAIINLTDSTYPFSILGMGMGSLLLVPKFYFGTKDEEERIKHEGRLDLRGRNRYGLLLAMGIICIGLFLFLW